MYGSSYAGRFELYLSRGRCPHPEPCEFDRGAGRIHSAVRQIRQRKNHPAAASENRPLPPRKPNRHRAPGRQSPGRNRSAAAERADWLCDAEPGRSDCHRQGVARAGVRTGKPGHGAKPDAPAGGRNGQFLRHPGLVSPGGFPAFRRAEAAGESGSHYGNAAGDSDSGRANQPAGPHCRRRLFEHPEKNQPGVGHHHSHYRASDGGYFPRRRPGSCDGAGAHHRRW